MKENRSDQLGYYMEKYALRDWFSTEMPQSLEIDTFSKGEFLCRENSELTKMYFLVEGKTKAFTTHDNGKITLIEYDFPLSVIGEMELIGVRDRTIAVQAMENCVCIAVQAAKCKEKLLTDAAFLRQLSRYLGRRIVHNSRNFIANQSHALEERVCTLILSIQSEGYFSESLKNTAEYLGTSYRHLQRIIAKLCEKKVLTRTKKGYQIEDYQYLKEHGVSLTTL